MKIAERAEIVREFNQREFTTKLIKTLDTMEQAGLETDVKFQVVKIGYETLNIALVIGRWENEE